MKKKLLIFGANGSLGKGIVDVIPENKFTEIHLFDFKFENSNHSHYNLHMVSDLSIEQNVENAFHNVTNSKESVFYLISTIGGYIGGKKISDTKFEDYLKMINMNLTSNFLILKHFQKLVNKSHSGTALFTTAFTGLNAKELNGVYGASKGALIHLVKTASLEGREIKLSVNSIAPLIIDTPENRSWLNYDQLETIQKPCEIGKFIFGIFENYNFVTGNIFEMTSRFCID
ncbi:MAG: SDR family NAD(P)-dependent oxidoreductase [Ignavibacteriaceae bacterium]|nr:SDR family NAD(P)-dependent oxidoreductase [Ignavibacteriaceae bacterium]